MSATGRDLREALNGPQQTSNPNSNAIFYAILVGIFLLAVVAVMWMTMKPGNPAPMLASTGTSATHTAEALTPNQRAERDIRQAIQNTPQGRMAMARTKQLAESDRVQNVKLFNDTMAQLQVCLRQANQDARIRSVLAGYKKRNAPRAESWTSRDANMLDRASRGEASDLELGLWAMRGGAANAAIDNMMAFNAFSTGQDMTSADCSRLVGKAQRKELDIQGRS